MARLCSIGAIIRHCTSATVQPPGISNQVLGQFTRASARPGVGPEVTHYVTRADIVSTVGETRLPGRTVMLDRDAKGELQKLYAESRTIALASHGISRVAGVMRVPASGTEPTPLAIGEVLATWRELRIAAPARAHQSLHTGTYFLTEDGRQSCASYYSIPSPIRKGKMENKPERCDSGERPPNVSDVLTAVYKG